MNIIKLIALVGMPGSGKSIAADFFRNKKFPVLRFGDQTDIGVRERGLPLTEENERAYREDIRRELGMAAMAIKIEPRIREAAQDNEIIILDGLYSWEEYIYLKDTFPSLLLLCIYAAPSIRYTRLRTRAIRPLNQQEAQSRDRAEIEHLNKGGPIAMADYVIQNEGSQEDLQTSLDRFLQTLQ